MDEVAELTIVRRVIDSSFTISEAGLSSRAHDCTKNDQGKNDQHHERTF